MNSDRNTSNEIVLLIVPRPEKYIEILEDLKNFNPEILVVYTKSGIEGLELFKKKKPCLTIVSDLIEDIPGCSVATVLNDDIKKNSDASIWLIDIEKIVFNTRADQLFPLGFDDLKLKRTIKHFLSSRTLNRIDYDNLRNSRRAQRELVPEPISNELFETKVIFSPFSFTGLSGDGLFHLYDEKRKRLYGCLFDCTGHDIMAYYNTNSLYHSIYGAYINYQIKLSDKVNLSDVLYQVNCMIFEILATEEKITAAVIWMIDFESRKMKYCSAGMPCFLIKRKNSSSFEKIKMQNPLLGVEELAEYKEKEIDISDVEKIFILTDGFSGLLFSDYRKPEDINNAKKDDTTLLMIDIK